MWERQTNRPPEGCSCVTGTNPVNNLALADECLCGRRATHAVGPSGRQAGWGGCARQRTAAAAAAVESGRVADRGREVKAHRQLVGCRYSTVEKGSPFPFLFCSRRYRKSLPLGSQCMTRAVKSESDAGPD